MKKLHMTQILFKALLAILSMGSAVVAQQTSNYIAKFSTPPSIINSVLYELSGRIGVGFTSPRGLFDLGLGGLNKNIRLGDYLDVGETDFNNIVYFGINSVLTSSSISGAYNRFSPTYAPGQGIVIAQSGGGQGTLDVYGINWNGSTAEKNFPSDFTHVIRVNYDGNVGIRTGTSTLYTPLTVKARPSSTAVEVNGASDESYTSIKIQRISSVTGFPLGTGTWGIASAPYIYSNLAVANDVVLRADQRDLVLTAFGSIHFGTQAINDVERMTILSNGNVGIGTTNPGTAKLAVEGKIQAREVVVTSTSPFPDYVFNDDYEPISLDELEKVIKENRRLPDIPSADEVKRNGINLGEMQAKLLKKIEELTLYLIDLKKQNQLLREHIIRFENQIREDKNNK